jgi:hypothetical protein
LPHVAVLAVVPPAGDALIPHPLPVAVVALLPSWPEESQTKKWRLIS